MYSTTCPLPPGEVPQTSIVEIPNTNPGVTEVVVEGDNQQVEGVNTEVIDCSFGSLPNITGLSLNFD